MRRAQVPLAGIVSAVLLAGCGAEETPAPPRVAATQQSTPPAEVLIVVNGASALSVAIGRRYAARRSVPERNLLALDLPVPDPTFTTREHETISRRDFEQRVRDPIAAFLAPHGGPAVQVIVTVKGVPLRIPGAPEERDAPFDARSWASVDAELALLGSGRDGDAGMGAVVNPYFAEDTPLAVWRAQHPDAPLRFLVARLTGYQTQPDPETGVPTDVLRLIDGALAETGPGVWLVDEDPDQGPATAPGNTRLLAPTAAALRALGLPLHHDRDAAMAADVDGVAGYASWGSNDRSAPDPPVFGERSVHHVPGRFLARSIAVTLVSTNARSFSDPTPYGQSLVADLIRLGVSGAAGHVYEPTLAGVPRPYLMLAAYARGVPAAEAYFRSVPYLGWTNVYVGDPLMQVPDPAPPPRDRDGDGVRDAEDVCVFIPDPRQRDANLDGFGDACDADLDGDGRVTPTDLGRLQHAIASGVPDPGADLDGDGAVTEADLEIAKLGLHLPPGPGPRPQPPR